MPEAGVASSNQSVSLEVVALDVVALDVVSRDVVSLDVVSRGVAVVGVRAELFARSQAESRHSRPARTSAALARWWRGITSLPIVKAVAGNPQTAVALHLERVGLGWQCPVLPASSPVFPVNPHFLR